MGDWRIYYWELCLSGGKNETRKTQRVPQTRQCGSEYFNKVDSSASIHQALVRGVAADHFKRKTQHLQLQCADRLQMEPICGVLHRLTMTELVLTAEVKENLLFSDQPDCLAAQTGTLKQAATIIYH